MTIDLQETGDGILLPIHAQPGSRRNAITGIHDGRLRVAVTQVAEKGKANQEILKLLAKELGISKSQLTLISGETSSRKMIHIGNVTVQTITERLASWLG